jgi:hypothetical protein
VRIAKFHQTGAFGMFHDPSLKGHGTHFVVQAA